MTRRPSDRYKSGTIRKWLNMDGLLSKAIYGSFLRFSPTQHTGQIHGEFAAFVKEQITQKLALAFEGEAKASKIRRLMSIL